MLVDGKDLRLPLDEYLLSPGDLHKPSQARRCIREAGFDFPPVGEEVDVGLRSWNERSYGIIDTDVAATDGYGPGARDPGTRPPRPHPIPTPERRAALEGTGGCIARVEAQQRRDSAPDVDRELPLRLAAEASPVPETPRA
jgi:hypothetical protein